jgi:hypothetical protein
MKRTNDLFTRGTQKPVPLYDIGLPPIEYARLHKRERKRSKGQAKRK